MNLDSLKQKISDLKTQSQVKFEEAIDQSDLDRAYRSYLGKKGEVNLLLKSLGSIDPDKRKEAGKLLNLLKTELEEGYAKKTSTLRNIANKAKCLRIN